MNSHCHASRGRDLTQKPGQFGKKSSRIAERSSSARARRKFASSPTQCRIFPRPELALGLAMAVELVPQAAGS